MYSIADAKNGPLAIDEQSYASAANQIRFTTFVSCLGVVARKGDTLFGVHLVLVGKEGPFDVVGAANVLSKLPKVYDQSYLVGFVDEWSTTDYVNPGYLKLIGGLQNLKLDRGFIPKKVTVTPKGRDPYLDFEKCVCTVKTSNKDVAIYYERYHPSQNVSIFDGL